MDPGSSLNSSGVALRLGTTLFFVLLNGFFVAAEFAENILGFVHLKVRHILVPRLEVVWLSVTRDVADNLATIRESRHSRLPLLCRVWWSRCLFWLTMVVQAILPAGPA